MSILKLTVTGHAYNASIREAEAGGWPQVPEQLGLRCKSLKLNDRSSCLMSQMCCSATFLFFSFLIKIVETILWSMLPLNSFLKIIFVFFGKGMVDIITCMWRSEGNLNESVVCFYWWVPAIKPRLAALVVPLSVVTMLSLALNF